MKISEIINSETLEKYCKEWKIKHQTCNACGIRKYCKNKFAYPNIAVELSNEMLLQKIIAYGRKQKLKKLLS